MKLFIFTLLILASSISHAIGIAQWPQIVEKIIATGNVKHLPQGINYTLSNIMPNDTSKSHQADYLFALVKENDLGVKEVKETGAISESWLLQKDQSFKIDQWLFFPEENGEVGVLHQTFDRSASGIISNDKNLPIDSMAAEKVWNKLIVNWLK